MNDSIDDSVLDMHDVERPDTDQSQETKVCFYTFSISDKLGELSQSVTSLFVLTFAEPFAELSSA